MIGEAFKIIRVFNDLTQQELSIDLGISHSFLSQIESGKRNPTLETVSTFAKRFALPVSSLIFFSEQLGPFEQNRDKIARLAFGRRLIGALSKIEVMAR